MFVFSRFLKYFAEVAREGSIRKAAEALNVSASAIDRQILTAEEELGVALFERLPSGLRPTAAGELLLRAAGDWRRDFDRVRSRIEDLKGLRRGEVQIALIDALAKGLIPDMVEGIQNDFPGITFSTAVLDNVLIPERLLAGMADFGIMLNPRTTRDLAVRAHAEVTFGVAVPPGHATARKAAIRFSECLLHPVIAPAPPLAISEQYQALVAMSGTKPRVVATSDNIQMIVSLAKRGRGLGLLSSIDVVEETERGELVFVPLADPMLKPLTLALCTVANRQLSVSANLALARLEMSFQAFAAAAKPHPTPLSNGDMP
jgi:DNA-binding transcriptional LysR family regulator